MLRYETQTRSGTGTNAEGGCLTDGCSECVAKVFSVLNSKTNKTNTQKTKTARQQLLGLPFSHHHLLSIF